MLTKIKGICNSISKEDTLVFTGLNSSASINRNYGIKNSSSDIFIMLDDDIDNFYEGWVEDLISPMLLDESIIITSARLVKLDGSYAFMMGDNRIYEEGVYKARVGRYKGYTRVPTACLAIRRNRVLFDERFIGSGYEDTAFMNEINVLYPDRKIMINNSCRVVHHHEQKNQGGKYWEHNKKHYLSLYPDDQSVINQGDLVTR